MLERTRYGVAGISVVAACLPLIVNGRDQNSRPVHCLGKIVAVVVVAEV